MKIIVLYGKSNSGKTTTLNLVHQQIAGNAKKNIIQSGTKDFESNFVYKGRKVAIYSLGDTLSMVGNAISQYSKVDVLIIAYNADKKHVPIQILQYASKITVINKTTKNDNDCESIINEI